jgi:calcium binding protein 39
MLISCTRSAGLTAALLREGAAFKLVELVQNPNFDIASEAYSVLSELLLSQKACTAKFVEMNFDVFFGSFHKLLEAPNYVAQRQALKLLGQMLLDRSFKEVMFRYIVNERFLQIHMNLLRHSSKAMQIAAIHIFKIFAVMPRKADRVRQILYRNKGKLLCLLDSFQSQGKKDAGFASDLQLIVCSLTELEAPTRNTFAVHAREYGQSRSAEA